MTVTVSEEVAALREFYRQGEALLAALPEPLSQGEKPGQGEKLGQGEKWDAAQHLHHLILVNASVTRLIPALASGKFAAKSAAAVPERLERLYEGWFPTGGRAPSNVEPSAAPSKDELLSAWREGLKNIEALEGQDLDSEYRLEHQFYGPLNPAEWLRFMGIHTRHHLELIGALS